MRSLKRVCKGILLASVVTATLGSQVALASGRYHWSQLAWHVGQSEVTRTRALEELRKIKNLDKQLVAALKTSRRAIALDVISAMKMNHLVPQLLEMTSSDQDGFLVLTLNSLLSEENKTQILDAYVRDLESPRVEKHAAGAIVAMLEPLGRIAHPVPKTTLEALLNHSYPEVRSAALYYIRMAGSQKAEHAHADLVVKAMSLKPYQLRLQAYFLAGEWQSKFSEVFGSEAVKSLCQKEIDLAVSSQCKKLLRAGGQ